MKAIFCVHLVHAHQFALAGVVDFHLVGDQLPKVLVTGHHIGEKSSLLRLSRERAYHVVGFIAADSNHGDVVGCEDALDVGHGDKNSLGRGVAIGLVLVVGLVAERLASRVDAHGDVRRMVSSQKFLQRVDEAKHGARVESGARDSGIAHHRIVGAKNECVGVEQQQFLVFHDCLVS